MRDDMYLAFRNLFRNTRRTIAILLTISLGAGALFSFEGFIHGVLTQYKENTIHAHYGHGQINTVNYRETVFAEPWNHWIENSSELEEFLTKQQGVEHIFPRVSFSALLKKGNATVSAFGQGIKAGRETLFFNSLNIVSGTNISSEKKGIILGKGLATALNADIGDNLQIMVNAIDGTISYGELTVTGIFHTGSFDFDNKIIRIQLDAAQELLKTTKIETISLGLSDEDMWSNIVKALKDTYPHLEATYFDVLDEIYYMHSVNWLNSQYHVVQFIILTIVLLGIFNTISASILERKQEIGNLRANGESKKDIFMLIISEGMLLGLIGGIIGLSLSYITLSHFLNHGILMPPGPGLTRQFYVSFKFRWDMVFISLSLSLLSAVAASALASIKVATMPIAKALRN